MSTRANHQLVLTIGVALLLLMYGVAASGQHDNRKPTKPAKDAVAKSVPVDAVERAISTICRERVRDSAGTQPIDEMAFQSSLAVTDPRVIAGTARAQTLLPVAKRLVPFALTKIASRENLEPLNLKWIVERVRAVNFIKPDVNEHDNAAWRPSEPDTITIGTVFLGGLRSDEAMIAVLAHELTHAIDGNDHALQPVFARIADKTSVDGHGAHGSGAEVTCELVAIDVVRDHISQTPSRGKISRRLARAFQKDCVQTDLTDDAHLSPRNTMRTLLTLEPSVSAVFAGSGSTQTKQRKAAHSSSRGKRKRLIGGREI